MHLRINHKIISVKCYDIDLAACSWNKWQFYDDHKESAIEGQMHRESARLILCTIKNGNIDRNMLNSDSINNIKKLIENRWTQR